jgi:hypothetical protein
MCPAPPPLSFRIFYSLWTFRFRNHCHVQNCRYSRRVNEGWRLSLISIECLDLLRLPIKTISYGFDSISATTLNHIGTHQIIHLVIH